MKQKKQEKLFKKYPQFFKERNLSPMESLMCFGIMCGDGWYKLIDETCEKIKPHTGKSFVFVEIKEKYGGLRIYYCGEIDKKGRDIITKAENKSEKICEECGNPGQIIEINNWYYTLCKKCENKLRKEKG